MVQTNAHVIAEALPRASGGASPERPIICTLQDGRIFEGKLAGYDRWGLRHVSRMFPVHASNLRNPSLALGHLAHAVPRTQRET